MLFGFQSSALNATREREQVSLSFMQLSFRVEIPTRHADICADICKVEGRGGGAWKLDGVGGGGAGEERWRVTA